MRNLASFISFLLLTVFIGCSGPDEAGLTCWNYPSCVSGSWPNKDNDCKCECSNKANNHFLVDAGNAYCVEPGSYVAFLEDRAHLDTFSLKFKEQIGQDGNLYQYLYMKSAKSKGGAGNRIGQPIGSIWSDASSVIRSKPEGDSIWIDFFDTPGVGSHGGIIGHGTSYSLPEANALYRMIFSAWVPGGIREGSVMHTTIHYRYLHGGPNGGEIVNVIDPISFDMIRVWE